MAKFVMINKASGRMRFIDANGNFSMVTRAGEPLFINMRDPFIETPAAIPPSPEVISFLVTYLLSQDIKVETVRSYLSGIKYYLMSKGVHSPSQLTPLAKQLLQGQAKLSRDALRAASRKER